MSTTAPSRRATRFLVGMSSLALVAGAVTATSTGIASAAPTGSTGGGQTTTVTLSPTTATAGSVTTAWFTMKNTATKSVTKMVVTGGPGFALTGVQTSTATGAPLSTSSGWYNTVPNTTPVTPLSTSGQHCPSNYSLETCTSVTFTATQSKYYSGNGQNGTVVVAVQFTPLVSGPLVFGFKAIALDGTALLSTTTSMTVSSSASSIDGWCVSGPSTAVTAGSPASFTAQAMLRGSASPTSAPCTWTANTAYTGAASAGAGLTDGGFATTTSGPTNGKTTFSATFKKAYASGQYLAVSGGGVTGSSSTFAVAPSANLVLTAALTSTPDASPAYTAGSTVTGTVTLKDEFGNNVDIAAASLGGTTSCTAGGSAVACDASVDPAFGVPSGNTASFSFKDIRPQTVSFRASYAGTNANTVTAAFVAGSTGQISVALADAPNADGTYTAGSDITGTVTLLDGQGNPAGNIVFTDLKVDPFSFACSVNGADVPCDASLDPKFSNFAGNTATLKFHDNAAQSVSFDVYYGSGTGALRQTVSATTSPAAPTTVVVSNQSGVTATAGTSLTSTVSLKDGFGNAVPITSPSTQLSAAVAITSTGTTHISFGAGPTAGTATVTFTDEKAETLAFTITYTQGAVTAGPSSTVSASFSAGPLKNLAITDLTDLRADVITDPTLYSGDLVELTLVGSDQYGNVVPVDGTTVTVTDNGPGAFVKSGTSGTNAVQGYYDLDATDVTLTPAVADPTVASTGITRTFVKQVATDSGAFVPGVPAEIVSNNMDKDNKAVCLIAGQSCGWVDLPNGANGDLTIQMLADGTTYLNTLSVTGPEGVFKDVDGTTKLYPITAPLPVTFVCGSDACPLSQMPNDNGSVDASIPVGGTCKTTGTVFLRSGATKYCLYMDDKEQVQWSQAINFADQLAGETSTTPIENSCTVDPTTHKAIAIADLVAGTHYPVATEIPAQGWDGQPIHSCLDIGSIDQALGSGSYFITFRILASDDYIAKTYK